MNKYWTAEENAKLRKLVTEQKTTSEIARILNKTKNAIIGRAHRLGLTFFYAKGENGMKGKAKYRKPKLASRTKPVDKTETTMKIARTYFSLPPPPPDPITHDGPLKFGQLSNRTCKFSVSGDTAKTYLFCGKPVHDRSFCVDHYKLCYTRIVKNVAA